jgi:hypothetical protein
MLVAAFALAALLTLSDQPTLAVQPATRATSLTHRPSHGNATVARPAWQHDPAALERRFGPVGDLYASRAKRRIASYLRMRLLELRLRGLERASEVIGHRLPLDVLLRDGY